jgi:hypothetical protein
MNYKRIHDLIIENAKTRDYQGYTESHHIIPKCLGGSNKRNNLVNLTLKEHYMIHILLVKIYPHIPQLVYAAWMMSNRGKMKSGALYSTLKEKYMILHKEKINNKLKEDPDYMRNMSHKSRGVPKKNKENYKGPKSEITCKKMSESALKREKVVCDICNKIVSKENLSNHKKAHTGEIVHSIEKRAKISQGVKNIPRIPCSLCSTTINPSNMWRHMKKHERLKNDLQCI